MKIFQTHGSDGLWHERTEDQYNKAYAGAKRILDTDCAKFKWYEKITGSFQKALAIMNTNGDMNCSANAAFYEPEIKIDNNLTPSDLVNKGKDWTGVGEQVLKAIEGVSAKELIQSIHVNDSNFKYIASTGIINGTLYQEIIRIMEAYAAQKEGELKEVKTPYELIMAERKRKAEKYGYDDKAIIQRVEDYGHSECALAAAAYCLSGCCSLDGVKMDEELFPWDLSYFKPTPNDRIKELVKAAAFIVDEIIRLQALPQTPIL